MEQINQLRRRIVVTVISDLVTDQRVDKVCKALHGAGYEIFLIGAKKRNSLSLTLRSYKTTRIPLLFQKNLFFYAEFNIRLFFRLLFTKADILLGNDLDVMLATFLAACIKDIPVVYDTHEYYLGQPELTNPLAKKVWGNIERYIFPRLNHIYTICDSFCELYYKDYQKKLYTVRNVPYKEPVVTDMRQYELLIRSVEGQIPPGKKLLLFQGAGINPERGVEELVMAMRLADPAVYHLLIVGGGILFDRIVFQVKEMGLSDRITIIPKVPFEVLRYITRKADLGFTLDKPNNVNHLYGLPNKIFDYLHEGVPVISTRLVEMEKIIAGYDVGLLIDDPGPEHIASAIHEAFADPERYARWKKNTLRVKEELNWEKESKVILQLFEQVKL
ncbi:MAG TPA: glycosyltransferase [Chitinophagaceae bacterium]|nr:glycosyltransferase [Chitinophagaceae bacterium]